jgi:hypothetical protein
MDSASYEKFVQNLLAKLISSDVVSSTDVWRLKTFYGKTGAHYEVDVSYEVNIAGFTYLTLVECKYWNRPVGRNVVDGLRSIVQDIGAHKGMIVSTVGFQEGALIAAKGYGIGLMKVADEQSSHFIFQRFSGPLNDILSFLTDLSPRYYGGEFKEARGIIYLPDKAREIIANQFGRHVSNLVAQTAKDIDEKPENASLDAETMAILRKITIDWCTNYTNKISGGFPLYDLSEVDSELFSYCMSAALLLLINGDKEGAKLCCPYL